MEYLFFLAGGFALLFMIILVSNRHKRAEHWLLVVLLLLIIISCYYVFELYHNDGRYYVRGFSELNYAIPLLYALLLWLYAKILLNRNYKLGLKDYIHFIPFVVFLVFLLFTSDANGRELSEVKYGYPLIKLIINPLYLLITLHMLLTTKRDLYNQYSFDIKMNHYWLSWVTGGGILLWSVALAGYIYSMVNGHQTNVMGDYFLICFLAVFLFILAYVGFNRTKIFQVSEADMVYVPETYTPEKDLTVPNTDHKESFQTLQEIMVSESPYLDPKLSLHKLSAITKMPTGKLSTIINQYGNQNFYDFINTYRVEAVKKMLQSSDMEVYSILGIAEECGFNSKASFNRVFKKIEGMTPTAYLKSL